MSQLSVDCSVVNQQVKAIPRKPPSPVVIYKEAEPIIVIKTENAVGTQATETFERGASVFQARGGDLVSDKPMSTQKDNESIQKEDAPSIKDS